MRRAGLVLDLAAVVVFVAIGRSVHGHGLTVAGLLSTTWPFAIGLALAWAALWYRPRRPWWLGEGIVVVVVTVAVGMSLRVLAGQGTAVPFIGVALAFLGAAMLGWRLAAAQLRSARTRTKAA